MGKFVIKIKTITTLAKGEWRFMLRSNVVLISIFMIILLTFISIFTSSENQRIVNTDRQNYQLISNQEFEAQPERHPHRVAHFGHFLFRSLDPLASFDSGVDAFTGHTLFLEAHRQNTANFGDVRQSSLLIRFGQLTPAFVLQVLVPLLLIFIGHSVISREKQTGTLRLLLGQGIGSTNLMIGKLVALSGIAALIFLPTAITLLWITVSQSISLTLITILISAYILWLLIWVIGITLVSSFFSNSRDALLALLTVWILCVILLPRMVPDVVNSQLPLKSIIETNIAVEKDLVLLGNGHNSDDPYFTKFKNRILEQYGVAKVEDLPVNYKGLVVQESERVTTELFNKYADRLNKQQKLQNERVDFFSAISPIFALKRLSMIASGSDLNSFNSFLQDAEDYRYSLVQHLNKLQTNEISYQTDVDSSKNRLDTSHWKETPRFNFTPISSQNRINQMISPIFTLLAWFILLALLIKPVSTQITRRVK